MYDVKNIRKVLSEVTDPEIPVLSILDLGILREIDVKDSKVIVTITPTYSGCPAMHVIEEDIKNALIKINITNVEVKLVWEPAWTTDWMSQQTKDKLKKYGISPPGKTVQCPQCNSTNIELISEFGATACKSMHKCVDCLEPFEHFKCI